MISTALEFLFLAAIILCGGALLVTACMVFLDYLK